MGTSGRPGPKKEGLKHERPMGYERAQAEGALDALEGAPPLRGTLRVAEILGMVVMISGIALVVIMFWVPG